MKRTTRNLPALLLLGALLISAAVGCRQESAQIDMTLPGNFDNCLVELIDFSDSTVINRNTGRLPGGSAAGTDRD